MTSLVMHSARPTPVARLLAPSHLVSTLWSRRDLIGQFSRRYFYARYRGTHLGAVWAFISPLLMLAVYTFVFNYIFRARNPSGDVTNSQFAVLLFCGISVYGIFSESVTRSSSLVLDNPNYVKKVVFPIEVLPVSSVASSLMFSSFSMLLVVLGTWVTYGRVPWTIVLIPLVLLPLVLLALGLAWFLASLGVFVRDISNLVVLLVSQLLFFLTPIFYRIENLPEKLRPIAELNPLAHIVEGARRVLVLGEQPDWAALGLVTLAGLLSMQLGYAWFMKSKRGFADVL
ncbi:MAG: ABC transporter permease [Phycisphaerales bacterium]|nr:ABC transporter permease [Phycisphaerales bacterium]